MRAACSTSRAAKNPFAAISPGPVPASASRQASFAPGAGRGEHGRLVGGGIADAEQPDDVALDVGAQRAERLLTMVVARRIDERARDRGRHAHRAGREKDRQRGRGGGARRGLNQRPRVQRGERRHDLVGAVELGGGTGGGEADAARARVARRAQPGGRVLDRDGGERRAGDGVQLRARQPVALRIGLAARDILGGHDRVEAIAQRRRVEHGVDLRAPRARHDRQPRARGAQRQHQRARPEAEPRMLARQSGIAALLARDEPLQLVVVDVAATAIVGEQRDDRPAIVEAEIATVDLVADGDAQHLEEEPERLEVNVLVVDQDAVEIEQDRDHRFSIFTLPCTPHAGRRTDGIVIAHQAGKCSTSARSRHSPRSTECFPPGATGRPPTSPRAVVSKISA